MSSGWEYRSFRKGRSSQRSTGFSPLFSSNDMKLWKLRVASWAATGIIVGIIGAILLVIGIFFWYSRDLPSPEKAKRREGFSTIISDRNDLPLYDIFSDKNRIPVGLADIPDTLKKATVSVEDKDFYKHQGFDPKGIFRALFRIVTFRGVEGGSTLTQQLVKNVLLTSERTLPRKIKEFILAVQLERKYSKDEILQMYFSEASYGGTMWGIESAAQGYFGKHAKDLTPLESIVLAGLPQSPTYYSPFGSNPKAYVARAEEVIRRMTEDGNLTQVQAAEYKRQLPGMKFSGTGADLKAPHFVMYIKKQLIDQFGEKMVEGGGLRVKTTLDEKLQEKSEEILRTELDKVKSLKVSNGAVLGINPQTGEILTYIGSKDFGAQEASQGGAFDVVSMGYRQPGSALKPIAYAAAFQKGYTPATVLMDVDTHFPAGEGQKEYNPHNYDGKFHGPTQIRFALGNSVNVPAVKITALVGIPSILKTANDMGLATLAPTSENEKRLGLSLVLGGGEVRLLDLTQAYSVFATGGIKNDLYGIERVTDSSGKVLYEHHATSGKKVLGDDVSFLISHILLDNNARKDVFGESSYLVVPGRTVSVKTGTTDDKRDNWTVGYTPSFTLGVWVGNNDNSAMNPKLASGITGAAPIWNRIMREALKDKKDEEFKKPDNVVSVDIDSTFGGLPHDGKPKRSEYFIKGTEPTELSSFYKKIKISKSDSGKLANPVEVATGQYDEKEFIVISESDPTSLDPKVNKWQEAIDAWVGSQSDSMYHPPKDTSNKDENSVAVSIKEPGDKTKIDDNNVKIRATAKALRDIKKMELYVDDSLKTTVNNNTLEEELHLDTGVHKIKVKGYDEKGNTGDSEITVGVKTDPNSAPTSTPVPSPTP